MMSLEQLQKEVMAEESASAVSNMTDGVWILTLLKLFRLPSWLLNTTVESSLVLMPALQT